MEGLKKLRDDARPINVRERSPVLSGGPVVQLDEFLKRPPVPPHTRNFRNFVSEVPTKTTTVTTKTSGTTVGFLLLFLGLLFGVLLILK